jgi:hypothetical protein
MIYSCWLVRSLRSSAVFGLVIFLLVLVFTGTPKVSASEYDLKLVQRVAESWLALIDRGAYEESWDRASGSFKDRVDKVRWVQDLKTNRGPLGQVISRKFRSAEYVTEVPDGPRGEYFVIQYDVVFETDSPGHETIMPYLTETGEWHVAGYFLQ